MGSSDCSSSESATDSCDEFECRSMKASGGSSDKKSCAIIARPNASAGYWLCCLLPAALATRYLRGAVAKPAQCSPPDAYKMLTIAAIGMCVESLCFFMYMLLDTEIIVKLLISFVPAMFTTLLYKALLQYSWSYGLFWGFAVTFCYQNAYIRVLRGLPRCFSYGEAAVLVQGMMLFVLNVVLQLPPMLFQPSDHEQSEFEQLNVIMMCALFCLLVACWLVATFKMLRNTTFFYGLMVLLLVAVTSMPIMQPLPIVALLDFMLSDKSRIFIVVFYLTLVCITVATIWWQLRHTQKASTRMRKTFHMLIVLVFIPGLLYQCAFLYIASGVALAIFTVLELFRILDIAPIANTLRSAFASFADEKDAGLLALTPFCLLIGCSLPLWISPCVCRDENDATALGEPLLLAHLAGILTIGCGDSAASVIGSKFGRTKWQNSTRSAEGTIAFVVAVLAAVLCLNLTGYLPMTAHTWTVTSVATLVSALVEARTDQIDNLVLPLVFYTIISCA